MPSTPTGFLFVEKKDGILLLCIKYRGLNSLAVKYQYPLALVPAVVEQVSRAKITELDLHSTFFLANSYNLVCYNIRRNALF